MVPTITSSANFGICVMVAFLARLYC